MDLASLAHREDKSSSLVFFTIFLFSFTLYLWSMPKGVALEDDGLFILASYFNGIAHAPGYPLYTLSGKLASLLPIGDVAARIHGLSALFGALTCVSLAWVARLMGLNHALSFLVAMLLAVSQTFWSQAIIAEVYTLNTLIFFLLLGLTLQLRHRYEANHPSTRLLALSFFLYGLGLSNHWPLLVLSTPCLLLAVWPLRWTLLRKFPLMLPFLVLGLLPYAWMIIRSNQSPTISFYGSIESFREFWFVISREGATYIDKAVSAGWGDRLAFYRFFLLEMIKQFTLPGFLLVVTGFISQWWKLPRTLSLALLMAFLGSGFILLLLLNFDADPLHLNIFKVYPLIPYGVMALWLGLGVQTLLTLAARHKLTFSLAPRWQWLIACVFIAAVLATGLAQNDRHRYQWGERYAKTILNNLAPNAILFADGDIEAGTIGYLHLIKGVRPDIDIYSAWGLVFGNRLFKDYQPKALQQQRLAAFIEQRQRPIYYITSFAHPYGYTDYGLFKKIDKALPRGERQYRILPDIWDYYESILPQTLHSDPWTVYHQRLLAASFVPLLVNLQAETDDATLLERSRAYLGRARNTLHGGIEYIRYARALPGADVPRLLLQLQGLNDHFSEAFTKSDFADFYTLRGILHEALGEKREAIADYQQAIARWDHPKNPARKHLEKLQ